MLLADQIEENYIDKAAFYLSLATGLLTLKMFHLEEIADQADYAVAATMVTAAVLLPDLFLGT